MPPLFVESRSASHRLNRDRLDGATVSYERSALIAYFVDVIAIMRRTFVI
jgi:hypothetical protein